MIQVPPSRDRYEKPLMVDEIQTKGYGRVGKKKESRRSTKPHDGEMNGGRERWNEIIHIDVSEQRVMKRANRR